MSTHEFAACTTKNMFFCPCVAHRRIQGRAKGAMAPFKFLENIVILCFERRFSKQNSVIRLKSNILAPQNFLDPPNFVGWLRHWCGTSQNITT